MIFTFTRIRDEAVGLAAARLGMNRIQLRYSARHEVPTPSSFSASHATKWRVFLLQAALGLAMLGLAERALGASGVRTEYVEGEVIVTFKPSVDLPSARQALGAHAAELAKHFDFLSQQRGRHLGLVRAKNRTTAALLAELSRDPTVETAEPNYLRWVSVRPPNDSLFPQMWAFQNSGQLVNGSTGTARDDVGFIAAWGLARPTTNEVVVAVLDTGTDHGHPDLAPNMWINPGEIAGNGRDDDHNGFVDDVFGFDFADDSPDPRDSGFHGTHVSGTIAAAGNDQMGVIGVDFQARIMALRVSSDGQTINSAAEIQALQYATMMRNRGVNVVAINASFGGGGFSSAESAAIQMAGNAGIIFCAAAGNSSLNHNTTSVFPASYRLSNMIVVAASDQDDALAGFSDFGSTTVDLAAPGVNILSTVPTSLDTASLPNPTGEVAQGTNLISANLVAFSGMTAGITATAFDCGLGFPTNFPPAVSNNIALISRGTLSFTQKVSNALAAGAKAAVIYNNASGNFQGTLQNAGNWPPTLAIAQADGLALQERTPVTVTVATAYQFLDGTSMATPHVAGAVALAAMNFPGETVAQRIQRILGNVDIKPSLSGLVRTGGRLNLQRMLDTDLNGLPDWWEQTFLGQLTGVNPNADPDHDGASNLAEFLAGTTPTNPTSALRLAVAGAPAINGFVVRWPSVAGKHYRLLRATNLTSGFNSVVQGNIAATPPTNTVTDPFVAAGARFYQLHLEQ